MKVLSVCGIKGSGKTTTIEKIIKTLVSRGYKVGSVKDIHFEGFVIDADIASNTNRHRDAGAALVCARGFYETDLLFPKRLPMREVLDFYEKDYDWVILEGVDDIAVPTIVTAINRVDLEERWSPMAFALSGRLSGIMDEYMGKPSVDATRDIEKLVDLIELEVYDYLPEER